MPEDILDDDISVTDAAGDNYDPQNIRNNRGDYVYDAYQDFSQPVIIRGTNRVFRQAPGLTVVAKPSLQALDDLIHDTKAIDSHLRLRRLSSVAQIALDVVTPTVITFHVQGETDRVYYLETPVAKKNPLAFKRLSSLLAIPYAFSKKNPTFLNRVNFDYYLKHALVVSDNPIPIDLVHDAEPQEISYVPADDQGQVPEGAEAKTISAYRITNVLKAPRPRGRAAEDISLETPPISTRIPFLSDILTSVKAQVNQLAPEIEPQLQAYSLGYDDSNKGQHFARIVFDSPATQFIGPNGETYQLGLNIETDFSGDAKDFGNVGLSFIVFRQICSNGLMADWGAEDQAKMRETYVAEQLTAASTQDGTEEGLEIRRQAEARFQIIFGAGGISIPVAQANAGLDTSAFTLGLKFFLESKTLQASRLAQLEQSFGEIDEEEFVRTVHNLQSTFKLASPELVKVFLLEFIAGEITGKQTFTNPWAVVNFLTLMSRAYETAVIADIERKAVAFAQAIYTTLVQKKQEAAVSLAAGYRAQINDKYLPE